MGRLCYWSRSSEEEKDDINNALDEVTDYVFEVLQTSNFAKKYRVLYRLGFGYCCTFYYGRYAGNPIRFQSIPLPHVVLDTGPDGMVDHVYRE